MKKKIKIKDPRGFVRTVGTLDKKPKFRVFDKQVYRDRHYMNIVEGYGIQKEVFDKYLRGRKGIVRVHEKDTGNWLVASIKTWTDLNHTANYGDGKQVFLSCKYMHNSDDFDRSVVIEEPEPEELTLPFLSPDKGAR